MEESIKKFGIVREALITLKHARAYSTRGRGKTVFECLDLAKEKLSVGDIVFKTKIPQPNVSLLLKGMLGCGLVTKERVTEGTTTRSMMAINSDSKYYLEQWESKAITHFDLDDKSKAWEILSILANDQPFSILMAISDLSIKTAPEISRITEKSYQRTKVVIKKLFDLGILTRVYDKGAFSYYPNVDVLEAVFEPVIKYYQIINN